MPQERLCSGRDPPGPPVVASASVVAVTPLAATATATPAVVAIVSVGPAFTATTNTKVSYSNTQIVPFLFRRLRVFS